MSEVNFISAILLGLMGAGHCLGMCGGIISSLSLGTENNRHRWLNITSYQLGRILSYTLFGFIVGLIGKQASDFSPVPVLKTLSGILLILMGLYISRAWMGLGYLERFGKKLWDKISPLSKKLLPVSHPGQAVLLGGLWGWLPCGLVYTSLGYALTLGTPASSAAFMLAFGIGTLPATLAAGGASAALKNQLNRKYVKWITALLFIAFGLYTLFQVYQSMSGGGMHHHH